MFKRMKKMNENLKEQNNIQQQYATSLENIVIFTLTLSQSSVFGRLAETILLAFINRPFLRVCLSFSYIIIFLVISGESNRE